MREVLTFCLQGAQHRGRELFVVGYHRLPRGQGYGGRCCGRRHHKEPRVVRVFHLQLAIVVVGGGAVVVDGVGVVGGGGSDADVGCGCCGCPRSTPGQVLLRWNLSKGTVVITTSTKPERVAEALACVDFELTAAVSLRFTLHFCHCISIALHCRPLILHCVEQGQGQSCC